MKERPIIFSGPMVRAILDGRKTQTRRVVKPQTAILTDELARGLGVRPPETQNLSVIQCPYGVPGDRLWVREAHALWVPGCEGGISYKADHIDPTGDGPAAPIKWRPSIHMPRYASRILLEITSVRVERLQDISENDCWAEGIDAVDGIFDAAIPAMAQRMGRPYEDAAPTFACLWESINGAGSWDANPWVWVLTFQRLGEVPRG